MTVRGGRPGLRRFTPAGVKRFRDELARLRTGVGDPDIDPSLLTNPEYSRQVAEGPVVAPPVFESKLEMADFMNDIVTHAGAWDLEDVGLWSWLSLFLFDTVCPRHENSRTILADPHYILEQHNWSRRYRHLVATPCKLALEVPEGVWVLSPAPPPVHGDLLEQLLGRLELFRIPVVSEAMKVLYFDEGRGRLKEGALTTDRGSGIGKPGVRRYLERVDQLQLTVFLPTLRSAGALLKILGDEFKCWRKEG